MNFLLELYLTVFTSLFLILMGTFSFFGMKLLFSPKWIEPLLLPLDRLLGVYFLLLCLAPGALIIDHNFLSHALLPATTAAELSEFRNTYLSFDFFMVRMILYFTLWGFTSYKIRRKSFKNGALLLILVLMSGSFASFDFVMTLEPEWHSTIFGLTLLLSGLLLAFNFALSKRLKDPSSKIDEKILLDWNTLQLAIIAVWTYLELMQWITIWSANLPQETVFYLKRSHGIWLGLIAIIALFQCAIPFVLLLSRSLKKSATFTRQLSVSCIALQLLHIFWIITPSFPARGWS